MGSTYAERWREDAETWRSRAAAVRRVADAAEKRGAADAAASYRARAARLDEHAAWCERQAQAGDDAEQHRIRAAGHRAYGHEEAAESEDRCALNAAAVCSAGLAGREG